MVIQPSQGPDSSDNSKELQELIEQYKPEPERVQFVPLQIPGKQPPLNPNWTIEESEVKIPMVSPPAKLPERDLGSHLGLKDYVIKAGDTLYDITKKHKGQLKEVGYWKKGENVWTVVKKIASINGHKDVNFTLCVGEKIKLPGLVRNTRQKRAKVIQHVVKKNESYGSIAIKYKKQLQASGMWQKDKSIWAGYDKGKSAVHNLCKFNNISINHVLHAGDTIRIPTANVEKPHKPKQEYFIRKVFKMIRPLGTDTSVKALTNYRDSTKAAERFAEMLLPWGPLLGINDNIPATMVIQGAMTRYKINGKPLYDSSEILQHPDPEYKELKLHPLLGDYDEYMYLKVAKAYKTILREMDRKSRDRKGFKNNTEKSRHIKLYRALKEEAKYRGLVGPAFCKVLGIDIEKGLQGLQKGQTLANSELHKTCQRMIKYAYADLQRKHGITSETPNNIGPKTSAAWTKDWKAMQLELFPDPEPVSKEDTERIMAKYNAQKNAIALKVAKDLAQQELAKRQQERKEIANNK